MKYDIQIKTTILIYVDLHERSDPIKFQGQRFIGAA